MDAVLRAAAIYVFLLVIFRITGKRSLAQITTLDFVVLLMIGEATQQALLGNDYSLTYAVIAISTLLAIDLGLSWLQQRFPRLGPVIDDLPLLLVEDGRMLTERMRRNRISESDILQAARIAQGLERLDQVKYAVLERTGEVSIIPRQSG